MPCDNRGTVATIRDSSHPCVPIEAEADLAGPFPCHFLFPGMKGPQGEETSSFERSTSNVYGEKEVGFPLKALGAARHFATVHPGSTIWFILSLPVLLDRPTSCEAAMPLHGIQIQDVAGGHAIRRFWKPRAAALLDDYAIAAASATTPASQEEPGREGMRALPRSSHQV